MYLIWESLKYLRAPRVQGSFYENRYTNMVEAVSFFSSDLLTSFNIYEQNYDYKLSSCMIERKFRNQNKCFTDISSSQIIVVSRNIRKSCLFVYTSNMSRTFYVWIICIGKDQDDDSNFFEGGGKSWPKISFFCTPKLTNFA